MKEKPTEKTVSKAARPKLALMAKHDYDECKNHVSNDNEKIVRKLPGEQRNFEEVSVYDIALASEVAPEFKHQVVSEFLANN